MIGVGLYDYVLNSKMLKWLKREREREREKPNFAQIKFGKICTFGLFKIGQMGADSDLDSFSRWNLTLSLDKADTTEETEKALDGGWCPKSS